MAKEIMFSTVFPSYHPDKGTKTHFVEKFLKGLLILEFNPTDFIYDVGKKIGYEYDADILYKIDSVEPKYHTIRANKRWKIGDKFTPKIWSGRPYWTKKITIGPDIEIKKLWDFELKIHDNNLYGFINGNLVTNEQAPMLAINDGLTIKQMNGWFNKVFDGQIICWNDNIEYNIL